MITDDLAEYYRDYVRMRIYATSNVSRAVIDHGEPAGNSYAARYDRLDKFPAETANEMAGLLMSPFGCNPQTFDLLPIAIKGEHEDFVGACCYQSDKLFDLFVENQPNTPQLIAENDFEAFKVACYCGRLHRVKEMFQIVGSRAISFDAVRLAAHDNNVETTKFLLEHADDPKKILEADNKLIVRTAYVYQTHELFEYFNRIIADHSK